MARLRRTLGAVGVGAAIAYFLDPDRGRSRRARARDQATAVLRRRTGQAEAKLRYAEGRLEGVAARARGAGQLSPEDDRDIVQGVRQALATLDFATHDVTIDVVDGKATLRGQVRTPEQIKAVQATTSGVPGVREVESWLHLPNTPAPNKAEALRSG